MQSLAAQYHTPAIALTPVGRQNVSEFDMASAIHVIACNRPAEMREVHSDLVRAPRSQFNFEQCEVAVRLQDPVERHGVLSSVVPPNRVAVFDRGVFAERKIDDIGLRLDCAVDEREISFSRPSLFKLPSQLPMGRLVLCEHHDAGRVAVESVNDAGSGILRAAVAE